MLRTRTTSAIAALAVTAGLAACSAQPTPAPAPPGPREALEQLHVAPHSSLDGYSDAAFGWPGRAKQAGWSCTTVDAALLLASPQARTQPGCTPRGGSWSTAWDGLHHTDPAGLTVDHVVPLKNAWISGAAAWPAQQRVQFANDLAGLGQELEPATASLVASKNGRGPEQWQPPLVQARCDYAARWVAIKQQWDLTVTRPERQALQDLLDRC